MRASVDLVERAGVLWGEVVGPYDDLFEAGSPSLTAALLATRIHRELGLLVTIDQVLDRPRREEFLSRVASLAADREGPLRQLPRPAPGGPGAASDRHLRLLRKPETSGRPAVQVAFHAAGERLDLDRLTRAFTEIVARHDILRTVLRHETGEVVVRGAEAVPGSLTAQPQGLTPEGLSGWLRAHAAGPFDLRRGPLLRWGVVRDPDGDVLFVDADHLAVDGVSMLVILQELEQLYRDGDALSGTSPWQYADYLAWRRAHWDTPAAKEELVAFWRRYLGSVPDQPIRRGQPHSRRTAAVRASLDVTDLRDALQREIADTKLTAPMLLVRAAAYHLQEALGPGPVFALTPVAGRPTEAFADVVGNLSTVVPIRVEIDPAGPVAANDQVVKQAVTDGRANTGLRLNEIGRALGAEEPPRVLYLAAESDPLLRLGEVPLRPRFALPQEALFDVSVWLRFGERELRLEAVGRADTISDADLDELVRSLARRLVLAPGDR
ncbi:condensation domain-containing protein [Micromonospora rubida]